REWKTAADELRWLSQGARDEDVRRLLDEYLPSVEFALFKKLRDAIESGRWGVGRFRLGRALASRLRPYRRVARASATGARGRRRTPDGLRPAGADGGVAAQEPPHPRPPQGRERDPGSLRSVPDPPARRTGGSDAALPPRRSPAPVPMAGQSGGAHIPRDSAARPRPSPRCPARAGRATKPHADQARGAGADGVPAPAPREVLGARVHGRPHLPDPHRR